MPVVWCSGRAHQVWRLRQGVLLESAQDRVQKRAQQIIGRLCPDASYSRCIANMVATWGYPLAERKLGVGSTRRAEVNKLDAVPTLKRDLTPSALSTRRWRDRRRRGVHLLHVEAGPEAVQVMVAMGLIPSYDESPETISRGIQDLLALLAAGQLEICVGRGS